jgi:hypothetical protein
MTNPLHDIFSSGNLSGLHVKLDDGLISAKGNMSLDQHSLQYSTISGNASFNYNGINMSSKISNEVTHLHNGELFIKEEVSFIRLNPEVMLFERNIGPERITGQTGLLGIEYEVKQHQETTDGLYLSLFGGLTLDNKNTETEINVSTAGLFVKNQNSSCSIVPNEIKLNDLSLTESQLNVSTSNFSLVNTGAFSLESNGLHLMTNASGLSLSGTDIMNTSAGGYVNKFLKVYIYEEGQYKPYNIPLLSVWEA